MLGTPFAIWSGYGWLQLSAWNARHDDGRRPGLYTLHAAPGVSRSKTRQRAVGGPGLPPICNFGPPLFARAEDVAERKSAHHRENDSKGPVTD
jgi:hypothetical protein